MDYDIYEVIDSYHEELEKIEDKSSQDAKELIEGLTMFTKMAESLHKKEKKYSDQEAEIAELKRHINELKQNRDIQIMQIEADKEEKAKERKFRLGMEITKGVVLVSVLFVGFHEGELKERIQSSNVNDAFRLIKFHI